MLDGDHQCHGEAIGGLTERDGSIPRAYLDWDAFVGSNTGVFLWEAFVTGKAKQKGVDKAKAHVVDALNACKEFLRRLPDPTRGSVLEPPHEVRSPIGGAVLWAGGRTISTWCGRRV